MNKLSFLRAAATVMFAAFTLCACDGKDDITPDNPNDKENPENPEDPGKPGGSDSTELGDDTFRIADSDFDVESVVGGRYFDRLETEHIYVAATNLARITTSAEVQLQGNFMYLLIDKSLVGREIDLMTETSDFTIIVAWYAAYFSHSSLTNINGYDPSITSGTAMVTDNGDGTYDFMLECKSNGITYAMRTTAAATEEIRDEVNHNSIYYTYSSSQVMNPVRAAFYDPDAGASETVYISSGAVDDFGMMQRIALFYAAITVPDEYADGRKIDLAQAGDEVSVYVIDNGQNGLRYEAVSGMLEFLKKSDDGDYEIHITADLKCTTENDKAQLIADFDGRCGTNTYEYIEPNEYTYRDEVFTINSAFVEKTSSLEWTVSLTAVENASYADIKDADTTIRAMIPAACFSTEYLNFGFSTVRGRYDTPLVFEYGSERWTSVNENAIGSLSLLLDGTHLQIRITTYVNLSAYYNGLATIIE